MLANKCLNHSIQGQLQRGLLGPSQMSHQGRLAAVWSTCAFSSGTWRFNISWSVPTPGLPLTILSLMVSPLQNYQSLSVSTNAPSQPPRRQSGAFIRPQETHRAPQGSLDAPRDTHKQTQRGSTGASGNTTGASHLQSLLPRSQQACSRQASHGGLRTLRTWIKPITTYLYSETLKRIGTVSAH